jgi:hypothetical protein
MPLNKLIKVFLLFFTSTLLNAASYGFTPSTVTVGEEYKVYASLGGNLPSEYDIRVSSSSSGKSSDTKLNGGPKYWYKYATANTAGTYRLYFHLYKNGTFSQNITSKSLTIIEPIPTINNPYTNPSSAVAGTEFSFYAPLSDSLPNGYSIQIEFYDNGWKFRTPMEYYRSTKYRLKRTITSAGTRKFRVAIFEGSTQKN